MPNVCKKQREKWRHIKDLDIPQCSHGQVELLLGANVSEAVIQQEVRVALPTPSKFSSWTKYKRTVAWILRFLRNSKLKGEQKRQRNLGPLTVSELHDAEKTILQMVQAEAYRTELHQLQAGSESSFCSEAVLNQLGITGQDEQLCLQTVEGTGKPQASTRVKLELSSVAPGETRRIIVPEAWSVPSLDISMPNVCKKQREKWRHIKDLDIPQCSHGQVELLLGANVSEAVIQQEVRVALPTPSKFSSWTKYKRTVAWILRFLRNSKLKGEQKRQRNLGPLTVSELHDAEKTILQMVQAEAYRTELHQLQAGVSTNSEISREKSATSEQPPPPQPQPQSEQPRWRLWAVSEACPGRDRPAPPPLESSGLGVGGVTGRRSPCRAA
ncbi:hypothetical protein FJT64_027652 [Amphibalanus amphitrite]|uniref:Uncharacterized protein n=1 Tax=Amphibalanus amphitrite TaxID=1232801 RepID=A0A6A4WC72_AMPAM|nr:hypothetical protein FJT64_027652 [Amphibalanus amphitrite]